MLKRWLWNWFGRPAAATSLHVEPLEDRWMLSGVPLDGFAALDLRFEANQGQTDARVDYLARGSNYVLFLTPSDAVLRLVRPDRSDDVVQMHLVGSNEAALPMALEEQAARNNYFVGPDRSHWHTEVPAFGRVQYQSVYDGIDLVYYGNQQQLEYDFVIAPGADPGKIRLSFAGAERLTLDDGGNLIVHAPGGDLIEKAPTLYQDGPVGRQTVAGSYVLTGDREIAFQVGNYDRARTLVIDPLLSYSTYLGGHGSDSGQGIALDAAGNIYVTGSTSSLDFPLTNAVQGSNQGQIDVFVAKLNAAGTSLQYATYLGGGGFDLGGGLTVDAAGNVVVTGTTTSTDFPTAKPIWGPSGASDAFVFRLNNTGSGLIFSTYLGGSSVDFGRAVAQDASGDIYVTGNTVSNDFLIRNAWQATQAGDVDAYLAKLSANGQTLYYSTYFGGSREDSVDGLAVNDQGVFLTGSTNSADLPTREAFQAKKAGSGDAFVARFARNGSSLTYSTYLGGGNYDGASGIAVDASGNAVIVGSTLSNDFPTKSAIQSQQAGNSDAFVARLGPTGKTLDFATFLGGSQEDSAAGVAFDASGNVYVTGATASADFPTLYPFQKNIAGFSDAFVAKLSSAGFSLAYSTYLGGAGDDNGQRLAVDAQGSVYLVGSTTSLDFPTRSALQANNRGSLNAFVAKVLSAPATRLRVSAPSSSAGNAFGVTVTALDANGNVANEYTGTVHFSSSDMQAVLPADFTFTAADAGAHTFAGVVLRSSGSQSISVTDTHAASLTGTAGTIAVSGLVKQLAVTGYPATTVAGEAHDFVVRALDSSGNVATGYTGTVHFTSSDPRAVLPADTTFTPEDQGTRTFRSAAVLKSVGTQSISVADIATATVSGTQSAIAVTPAAQSLATRLKVEIARSAHSGSAVSVTVTAVDGTSFVADDYRGTIRFTSTDAAAALPAEYAFTAADAGSHTFTQGVNFQAIGLQSLTATDKARGSITGTQGNVEVKLPIQSFEVTGLGTLPTAGVAGDLTITVRDILNNVATGYAGTIRFSTTDARGGLPADYTFTAADQGVHAFASAVTLRTAGTQSLSVRDAGNASLVSNVTGIVVVPALASTFRLTNLPTTFVAETPQSLTVAALDAFGNSVTNYAGTVQFRSSDARANLPADFTFTAIDQGSHSFAGSISFTTAGIQSLTVADKNSPAIAATQSAIAVQPAAIAPATHLGVTVARTTTAGEALAVTVTALDASNKAVSNYTGTLHFASTDGQAQLPVDTALTASDNGSRGFSLNLRMAGTIRLTVRDTNNPVLSLEQTIQVQAGAAASLELAMSNQATAGAVQALTVTLRDAFGNQATNYSGTLQFHSTDPRATLPADTTFTAADRGSRTWQLTQATAGVQMLEIADASQGELRKSQAVTVAPAAVAALVLSGMHASTNAGEPIDLTVRAQDAFGNTVTDYNGTLRLSSNDSQAELPAAVTFLATDAGTHRFRVALRTGGSRTVTLTDAVAGLTSSLTTTVVVPVQTQGIDVKGLEQSLTAGQETAVTITMLDENGFTATGFTGAVRFASSDAAAILPETYVFRKGDAGSHGFVIAFKTAGKQTLAIRTDGQASANLTVDVVPARVVRLVVQGLPNKSVAGAATSLTVRAHDMYGNVVTNYTGKVSFYSSDARAVLPTAYTFTPEDRGAKEFAFTFRNTGSQIIFVYDTLGQLGSGVGTLAVEAGELHHFKIGGLGVSVLAGQQQTIRITAQDVNGNTVTNYAGTLRIESSDTRLGVPATYSFTAADQGMHSFQATFATLGTNTLMVADREHPDLRGSFAFRVQTGPVASFKILGLLPLLRRGVPTAITIIAQDAAGNIVRDFAETVRLVGSAWKVPQPASFTASDNGMKTFNLTPLRSGKLELRVLGDSVKSVFDSIWAR